MQRVDGIEHFAHRIGCGARRQIDRHANLNSTVIGDYSSPKVRMPGAGGAPPGDRCLSGPALLLNLLRRARRVVDRDRLEALTHGAAGTS